MPRLVRTGCFTAVDGTEITLEAQSICVHGDSHAAVTVASRLRADICRFFGQSVLNQGRSFAWANAVRRVSALSDGNTVRNSIAGVKHHLFTRGDTFQNLGKETIVHADPDRTAVGPFIRHGKDRPAQPIAEQRG